MNTTGILLGAAVACVLMALGCEGARGSKAGAGEGAGASSAAARAAAAPAAPSTSAPPAFPGMPATPPRTTASDLRRDGGLMARHEHIVADAKKGGHEIAFIGDSITEGWLGAGKESWEKVWGPRKTVNCGIGGDRTQHVIGRLDQGLLDALAGSNNHITRIVLLIGTNNSFDDSADDIALGVQAITDRLHAKLPEAKITLMAVFPRGQWPNPLRDKIGTLNVRLSQLAAMHADHIRVLDINGKFLTPQGEIPHDLMPDYLHLSAGGYRIWSEAIEGEFK